MTNLESAVLDFIKENSGVYRANDIADSMKYRVDWAVINLVNRGIVNIKLDWTLSVPPQEQGGSSSTLPGES